ncbi:MAG: ABC transporter ATP-binding protein [Clostridium sp.]
MLKKFISYYKRHKVIFIIDMICAFLVAALDLFFPMFTKTILDSAIPNQDIKLILRISGVLAVLYTLKLICNYVMDYWGHVMGVRIQYDMRKEIFLHLQELPFSYFDNNKTGQLMSRIVNDLNEISELAHHGPEDLFISVVMILGSFILLCKINVTLTIIIFAFIPFVVWFSMLKRVKMARAFDSVRKKIANVNERLENSISGIRVSKAFTNEKYELERFDKYNIEFRKAKEYSYKCMAEFLAGIRYMVDMLNVLVISSGGYFAYKQLITPSELVAYLLYINHFMQPIRKLTIFVEQYQSGMSGFKRFLEIINTKSEVIELENAIEIKNIKGNIRFNEVTFNYENSEEIISGMNLEIKSGETVALVGPSGGGKTTICHLIPRFYDISTGSITIDGINIKDLKIKFLRESIGIVQQDVFLFTGTIKENIVYGNPDATYEQIVEAAQNANMDEFINELPDGYDTFIGEKGIKLSGGQKQRIAIARIFLKNPPILILDEATSALDNATEKVIQKSLEYLAKGRTTLIVAHRLSTIKNADKIIVITNEGIVEQGKHDELLDKKGVYSNLYNSQFKNIN